MKLYHAVALVLVGWYLMTPPVYDAPSAREEFPSVKIGGTFSEVRSNAPLDLWELDSSYDSANACQAAIVRLTKFSEKEAKDDPSMVPFYHLQALRLAEGHCIATDDPRLKEK